MSEFSPIQSLAIQGYRAFADFRVDGLGLVNLIVGQNSVGKTSFLEALRIYSSGGSPAIIGEILRQRSELGRHFRGPSVQRILPSALDNLFSERQGCPDRRLDITDPMRNRSVTLELIYNEESSSQHSIQARLFPEDDGIVSPSLEITSTANGKLSLNLSGERSRDIFFGRFMSRAPFSEGAIYVSPNGLTPHDSGRYWDNVALTPLEDDVVQSLKIVNEGIQRITLVAAQDASKERTFLVKISDSPSPLSLGSLGDGIQRIMGIILSIANSEDGVVCVDEIENGIHYSIQPKLWELVFDIAHRLNVQIFATTHSWDCIESFAHAARKTPEQDGTLVRLERKGDKVQAVCIPEDILELATQQRIEVR